MTPTTTYQPGQPICYNTRRLGWLDGTVTHLSDRPDGVIVRIELRHQERIIVQLVHTSSEDLVPSDYWDKR
jgi:hypothetical protein